MFQNVWNDWPTLRGGTDQTIGQAQTFGYSRDLILTTVHTVYLIWKKRAHGRCDRSTGDAYSSMAPDPSSDIFRGRCTPILWFVFPIGRRYIVIIFVISSARIKHPLYVTPYYTRSISGIQSTSYLQLRAEYKTNQSAIDMRKVVWTKSFLTTTVKASNTI
jgi:hypothetical protein